MSKKIEKKFGLWAAFPSEQPPHGHIVETMDWEWDDMFPYLEKYQYYWNINFFVGWIFKALVNSHLTIIKVPSENRIKRNTVHENSVYIL